MLGERDRRCSKLTIILKRALLSVQYLSCNFFPCSKIRTAERVESHLWGTNWWGSVLLIFLKSFLMRAHMFPVWKRNEKFWMAEHFLWSKSINTSLMITGVIAIMEKLIWDLKAKSPSWLTSQGFITSRGSSASERRRLLFYMVLALWSGIGQSHTARDALDYSSFYELLFGHFLSSFQHLWYTLSLK